MIYPLLTVDNIKNKLYYLYDLILFVCFLKLNISIDDNINIFNLISLFEYIVIYTK